jgi:hypothetical protein
MAIVQFVFYSFLNQPPPTEVGGILKLWNVCSMPLAGLIIARHESGIFFG